MSTGRSPCDSDSRRRLRSRSENPVAANCDNCGVGTRDSANVRSLALDRGVVRAVRPQFDEWVAAEE
eukprot:gene12386-biopygen8505